MGAVGKKRYYINSLYEFLKYKKGFLMLFQEWKVEEEMYLKLKKDIYEAGGKLVRFSNSSSFLSGGRTLWLFWPSWIGWENYKKWKKEIEEKGSILLFVIHEGSYHYLEELEEVFLSLEKKKKERFFGLKKKTFRWLCLKEREIELFKKLYAYVTSIKETAKSKG